MFTRLDYSSALEYSIIRRYTNIVYYYYYYSRNILIIHFGLLKERTLDSVGHDLWKQYNVNSLLWMIHYISSNRFTQWILIGA